MWPGRSASRQGLRGQHSPSRPLPQDMRVQGPGGHGNHSKPQPWLRPCCKPVLVSSAAVANGHKLGGLKQQTFIICPVRANTGQHAGPPGLGERPLCFFQLLGVLGVLGLWPHCSGLGPRLREVSSPYVSSPPLCFLYEDTVIGFQLHTDNPGRPHLETLGHLQSRHFQARPCARVWAAASWEALGALGAGAAPCQGLSSGSRGEAAGSPALRAPLFPAGALKACDLDWPVGCPGPSPWKLPFLICPPCSLGCLVGAQPSPHGCRSDSVGLRGWNQDSASLRACVSFLRDLVEVKELVRLEILFRSHVSPGMTLHTAQSLSRRCPR